MGSGHTGWLSQCDFCGVQADEYCKWDCPTRFPLDHDAVLNDNDERTEQ